MIDLLIKTSLFRYSFKLTSNGYVHPTGARLPMFLIFPISMHVFVGESFTLDCTADQFTLSYRWEKDGRTLSPSSSVVIEAGEFLTIYNASQEDSGVYTCIAIGENGENMAQALVNVTGPLLTCDGGWVVHACVEMLA